VAGNTPTNAAIVCVVIPVNMSSDADRYGVDDTIRTGRDRRAPGGGLRRYHRRPADRRAVADACRSEETEMRTPVPQRPDRPLVGRIYRDRFNRSLLVWRIASDRIVIEHGDGRVSSVGHSDWARLGPRPARF
jgi:hypothetical protein